MSFVVTFCLSILNFSLALVVLQFFLLPPPVSDINCGLFANLTLLHFCSLWKVIKVKYTEHEGF